MNKPGQRHPLLIYKQMFDTWRVASLLIAICGAVLVFFRPPPLDTNAAVAALLVLTIMGGFLFIYTLIAPRLAFVQCHSNVLQIMVPPFFRLSIAYKRMRTLRPYKFVPQVPNSQRHLVEPYIGQTVVALELNSYPMAEKALRFWLHPTMFAHDFKGLVLVTPDWMKLSHEIDSYISEWRNRRRSKPSSSYTSSGHTLKR